MRGKRNTELVKSNA